jgi:hypothetical protein
MCITSNHGSKFDKTRGVWNFQPSSINELKLWETLGRQYSAPNPKQWIFKHVGDGLRQGSNEWSFQLTRLLLNLHVLKFN